MQTNEFRLYTAREIYDYLRHSLDGALARDKDKDEEGEEEDKEELY